MTPSEILTDALRIVERDPLVPAQDAIQEAARGATTTDRLVALELFGKSLVRPISGQGVRFQAVLLERAIWLSKKLSGKQATDPASLSHGKQYRPGQVLSTVARFGLRRLDERHAPAVPFQLSRRVAQPGCWDLPEATSVVYLGIKRIYEELPNSKRLIFRIPAGSHVLSEGSDASCLEQAIDVAGVINHVDPDDPYNVQLRRSKRRTKQ